MRERSWRESCGTEGAGGSPSIQRRAAGRAAGEECRPALSLERPRMPRRSCCRVSQLTQRSIGSERPRMHRGSCCSPPRSQERRPVDLEPRLGAQRSGQASQLTWRGIGSEGPRMPPRSCHTLSRGRERRSVDLDCRKSPARFRGSRHPREAVTAAGRDITGTCARVRTAPGWRWRLSGLDHVRRPAERVPQGGEREGWPGSCRRTQPQVDLSRRVGTPVSRKRRLPSGSKRWREAKRRPAQRLSCEAGMHGFVCLQEVVAKAAQGKQSGCREDVTPTAAKKGESRDESGLLTEDRDRAGLRGSANRGSRGSQGWDPGGMLMGA